MKPTRRRRGSCCSRSMPTSTKSLKRWNRRKAAGGECRVTLLSLPGAGCPAFVTSSTKRTDSSTGCIDASRTRDPGEWPGLQALVRRADGGSRAEEHRAGDRRTPSGTCCAPCECRSPSTTLGRRRTQGAPRTTPAPTTRYRCLASPSGRTAGKFSGYCRRLSSRRRNIHQWLVSDADLLFVVPGAHPTRLGRLRPCLRARCQARLRQPRRRWITGSEHTVGRRGRRVLRRAGELRALSRN
jgi:hypothetical protein